MNSPHKHPPRLQGKSKVPRHSTKSPKKQRALHARRKDEAAISTRQAVPAAAPVAARSQPVAAIARLAEHAPQRRGAPPPPRPLGVAVSSVAVPVQRLPADTPTLAATPTPPLVNDPHDGPTPMTTSSSTTTRDTPIAPVAVPSASRVVNTPSSSAGGEGTILPLISNLELELQNMHEMLASEHAARLYLESQLRLSGMGQVGALPEKLGPCQLEDDRLCVVCLEEPRTHAFPACMHKCVCGPCAGGMCAQTGGGAVVCPLCRTESPSVRMVYE